jgi:hypothetical protein
VVSRISQSLIGKYNISYPKLIVGILVITPFVIYGITKISWTFSITSLKSEFSFYLIVLIGLFFLLRTILNFRTEIEVKGDEIIIKEFRKIRIIKIKEIVNVYYDKGLSIELKDDYFSIPRNTTLNDYDLYKDFEKLGLNCNEHSSD